MRMTPVYIPLLLHIAELGLTQEHCSLAGDEDISLMNMGRLAHLLS